MKTAPHFRYFAFLAIVVMLYSIGLSADAPAFMPTDDLADGAWWADPARNIVLFNDATVGGFAGALAVGPLSVAWHYLSFSMFGISLWSLRLFSLLPALAALIILKHRKGYAAALLLAACPWWFAAARSALPEVMQGLLLLLALEMSEKESRIQVFGSGILGMLAVLFKVSFIYLIPLLLVSPLVQKRYRQAWLSFTGMGSVALLAWLCWFIPHAGDFAPFYRAFSADYYRIDQLLDPVGIVARLVFFDSKFILQNPWMAVAFFLVLWEAGQSERISLYQLVFILGLGFLLASDLQNRRFIPLLPLIPFALMSNGAQVKVNRTFRSLVLVAMVWIGLGIWAWGHSWFSWDGAYFHVEPMHAALLLGIPAVLLWMFRTDSNRLLLHRLGLIFMVLGWTVHAASGWAILFGLATIFFVFYRSRETGWNMLIAGGALLILMAQWNRQYQLQTAMDRLRNEVPTNAYVAGNSGSFMLALESRAKVLHYPLDLSHKAKVQTLAFISSTDQTLSEIQQLALTLDGRFGGQAVNYQYIPIWHGRDSALIVHIRPFP